MNDYIDRAKLAAHFLRLANEARAEFEEFGNEAGTIADTFFDAAADVRNFPAADVVPVVRCQDCRHYDNGDCTNPYGLKLPGTKSFCDCGRGRQMGMEEHNDGTL